jgi:hypothetical protein
LYLSPNIIHVIESRRMRWVGHVACMGDRRGAYSVLAGKPERKRPLARPTPKWKDNTKMGLQEIGCAGIAGLVWLRIGTGGRCLHMP